MRRISLERVPPRVRFLGLLAAGGLPVLVGFLLLFSNLGFATVVREVRVPPGPVSYGYTSFDAVSGASFSGSVAVTPPGSGVDLYVLDAAGFERYADTLSGTSALLELHTSDGVFEVTLPESGKYYLVADHRFADEDKDQRVRVESHLTHPEAISWGASIGLVALGIPLVTLAWRGENRKGTRRRKRSSKKTAPVPGHSPGPKSP